MKYFKIFITFRGNFAILLTPLVKILNCNQSITFTSKFTNLPKRVGKSEKKNHFEQFDTNKFVHPTYKLSNCSKLLGKSEESDNI